MECLGAGGSGGGEASSRVVTLGLQWDNENGGGHGMPKGKIHVGQRGLDVS